RTMDRHRGNSLARLDSRDTSAEPIHHANQIPARGKRHPRRFRMNTPARHDVGQGDAGSEHPYPDFTILRLRALFFNHLQCLGSAVASYNDALVLHAPLTLGGAGASAA